MNAILIRFVSILAGFSLSIGAHAQCTAGQFDASFGPAASGGYVQVSPWLQPSTNIEGLAFGGIDSKIYIPTAVAFDNGSGSAMAGLVRTGRGGAFDHGYGGVGLVAPGGQALPPQRGSNVALTQDGNGNMLFVVVNSTGLGVSRFLPDGTLDSSFGVNGVAQVNLSSVWPILGMVTAADGSVFIGTTAKDASSPAIREKPVAVKLTPAGALDASFGVGGIAFAFPAASTAIWGRGRDLKLLSTGEIVVSGHLTVPNPTGSATPTHWQAFVARLLSNGAVDTSFGSNGFAIRDFGSNLDAIARKLAIQTDGKIVAVGGVLPSDGSDPSSAVVYRFNSNGSIDTSFGSGGSSTIRTGVASFAYQVVLQNNGKIVTATGAYTDATYTVPVPMIARLLTTGQLDPAFGSGAFAAVMPAGSTAGLQVDLSSIAMAGNGRIAFTVMAANSFAAVSPLATFLAAIDTGTGPGCH